MNVLYNSFNNDNKILAKKNFLIKNKDEYVCVDNNILYIENVIIIDKKDYIQFDLYYLNTHTQNLRDDIDNIYKQLIDKKNMKKYNDYIYKNSVSLYLNNNDLNFSIEILDISDTNIFISKSNIIISLFIKNKEVVIKVDEIISDKLMEINKFFSRMEFTEKEKKFIINNFHQQKNKIAKTVKNKQDKNKDTKNFMDFMSKDPNNLSKFKVTEEERKIFSPNALKIIDGVKDPNKEINNLIGLQNVKTEILKLNSKLEYRKKRESRNIYDAGLESLHMCFYGNPGTGKTTVARIMTGLLYNMGYITKNKCIEINANEMKGTSIGQTAIKTKIILRNAKNKVLFIDEAYALCDKHEGYGQEAIDTIIKEMEDNKHNLVIIFAGYKEDMKDFIAMNDGLKSRINRYIEFDNYDTIELSKIFLNLLHSKGLLITTDALIKTMKIFKKISLQQNFANGRFVRNYFEEIEEEHAFNTKNIYDEDRLDTINDEDINENIISQLIAQNER